MNKSTTEIVLHLSEIGKFFNIPDPDPLAGNQLYEPGINMVYDQVRANGVKSDTHLLLYLPKKQVTPENEQNLKTGIEEYCKFQIYKLSNSLDMQKRQGRQNSYVTE